MASITVDFINLVWGYILLVLMAHHVSRRPKALPILMVFSISLFLLAQSGWTTAYLSGYEWGRDVSNYIWFVFNASVLGIFTLSLCGKGDK